MGLDQDVLGGLHSGTLARWLEPRVAWAGVSWGTLHRDTMLRQLVLR